MSVSSEGEARQLVLSILPQESARRKCLTAFADAISEASARGNDKWAVTHRTNGNPKIRLVVGHIIVCTLGSGRIWMALDKDALATSGSRSPLEASDDWNWGTGRYAEYRQIPSRNGHYLPSDEHNMLWPEIRGLHFEAIRRAADQTTMDRRTPKKHTPAILQYLRNELGRDIPDPRY